jgi:hypothetical protein
MSERPFAAASLTAQVYEVFLRKAKTVKDHAFRSAPETQMRLAVHQNILLLLSTAIAATLPFSSKSKAIHPLS